MNKLYMTQPLERTRFDKKLYIYLFSFTALISTASLVLAMGFMTLNETGLTLACFALAIAGAVQAFKCWRKILRD